MKLTSTFAKVPLLLSLALLTAWAVAQTPPKPAAPPKPRPASVIEAKQLGELFELWRKAPPEKRQAALKALK